MVEDGKTPILDAKVLEELGFKIVIYPVSALLAVTKRLQEVYATLLKGQGLPAGESRVTFQKYNELVGLPEILASAAKLAAEEH
jgi:2-methylisocitrate lyase-like PEP mutase family enzyme